MSQESPKDDRPAGRALPDAAEAGSLDPSDWRQFRALCHEMLDEALGHLETAGAGAVWRPVPEAVKTALAEPPPYEPQGAAQVCADFRRLVLPYATGNTHPRFFGWVHGSGTPGGMLAELLAAALNANLGGRDHGPIYVERQVVDWCRQLFGFPPEAGGLLVSGTSLATLIGLTVARNSKAEHDLRRLGLGPAAGTLVAYASSEAHGSVAKAIEILGLGNDALRRVPVDSGFRMDLKALAKAIARDRESGLQPFCVVATAGTVNTGAIDDLAGIAEICHGEDLWLHVDGAFGALAILSERLKPRLAGIERADSLAFDFHKWLHVPYDAGCILVRRGELQRQAFSSRQDYLAGAARGLAGGEPWFCEYGPELSRGFRALKVWFTVKEHGLERLGHKIEENCRQAAALAARVQDEPCLELMAAVSLNIVCFRFIWPDADPEALDLINGEIVTELQERGIAAPSTTQLDGALAIRVNITNHRSRQADFDILVEAVLALGAALLEAPGKNEPGRSAGDAASGPSLPPDAHNVVAACLRRPELRVLLGPVTVSVDPELSLPFSVSQGTEVVLGLSALANASVAAFHMRHALELAMLQRLTPGHWMAPSGVALAVLACRAAARHYGLLNAVERAACRSHLPPWLSEAFGVLAEEPPSALSTDVLADLAAPLLALQGGAGAMEALDAAAEQEVLVLLRRLENLGLPAEHLLVSGGDGRLRVDPESGLNGYGCSPRPRPESVAFSSCTASTISGPAYDAVERLRQEFIAAAMLGDFDALCSSRFVQVKKALLGACGATNLEGAEVVLAASGTDTEFCALYFALSDPGKPLVNIVIAPDETGSGVVHAAAGRHFGTRTPAGTEVEVGEPLAGLSIDLVRVTTVAARDELGVLRDARDLGQEVEHLADEAVAAGARCLVHLLDSAKTGWRAPDLGHLMRLCERHGPDLDVVVDACQMRARPERLRDYLDRGFMVQVTGSKFFAGPPFSGALLLPPKIAARHRQLAPLPDGLADYAARIEWPDGWQQTCQDLPDRPNLGLLCRWTAALSELRAFNAVPEHRSQQILARFGQAVRAAIAERPLLELVPGQDANGSAETDKRCWDRLETIFSFTVWREQTGTGRGAMGIEETKAIYRLLNMDLSGRLPAEASESQRRIAARPCHIGQPVKLRRGDAWLGALRLCAGARLVSRVSFDASLGETPAARLERQIEDARMALDKVALIVRHWDTLCAAGLNAPAPEF